MAALKSYSRLAVLAERERCAKAIESSAGDSPIVVLLKNHYAKVVRESGE